MPSNKSWAIRRHKNSKEFEYLADDNIWYTDRNKRREFKDLSEAYKRCKAYNSVGVHAKVVPYGVAG